MNAKSLLYSAQQIPSDKHVQDHYNKQHMEFWMYLMCSLKVYYIFCVLWPQASVIHPHAVSAVCCVSLHHLQEKRDMSTSSLLLHSGSSSATNHTSLCRLKIVIGLQETHKIPESVSTAMLFFWPLWLFLSVVITERQKAIDYLLYPTA